MTPLQSNMLNVLKDYISFCNEHNLTYWISSGTLLGAIRHGGFIPWDDDIDVAMPINDYNTFLALRHELHPKYVVQCRDNDPNYPFIFAKLCDTSLPLSSKYKKSPLGTHIDIFPLYPTKKLSLTTTIAFYVFHECEYVIREKVGWRPYIPNGLVARMAYRCLKILSVKLLKSIQNYAIHVISHPDGAMLCSIGGAYHAKQEFTPKYWFDKTEIVSFEGVSCAACWCWNEWLTWYYGDYLKLPPENERHSHHSDE